MTNVIPNFPRLSVVLGNSEARTELYKSVLRRSTGAVDNVIRQEFAGCLAGQGSKANDGGVW